MKTIRVALAGNPNSGKTTLFNAFTGAHLQVGNYPGVTVEKREGTVTHNGRVYTFTDLPGIYSLTAYSEDEVVSRDFLINEKPDYVIDILDSTNLVRHLNLAVQLQELRTPVIGALNMVEEAESKGIEIHENILSASLRIPFVKINAKTRRGLEKLFALMESETAGGPGMTAETDPGGPVQVWQARIQYGEELESRLEELEKRIAREKTAVPPRWLAVKLLEKDDYAWKLIEGREDIGRIQAGVKSSIEWLEKHFAKSSEIVMAEQRYGYIRGAGREAVTVTARPDFSLTETIDKVVMNRFLAMPLFVLVLWAIFKLTFSIGAYPQAWLESFFGFLAAFCGRLLEGRGLVRSLVVDGIIAGVGGVLSFVPLIVILFFFMSILEDLGYMSRAAFATDKLLHTFGLHGQSIFPMMLGFGCSVPAIMASRTLKSKRDRIITVLVTPMMSCGAKLPIHVLLAGAFFGKDAGNMVMLVYAAGVLFSILSAFLLKHTILRGEPTPFVLELPPYRLPTLRGIGYHVWEKTWSYIKRAGCVILSASILVWACTTFPAQKAEAGESVHAAAERQLEQSFAGRAGHFIEPVFRPLGFNWKMSVATLTGFTGKEVVASTLSVLYRAGGDDDSENITGLQKALREDPSITPRAVFGFMLFILLIPPCFAALATIKSELGWRWLGFEFGFLFAAGWLVAFVVTRIGALF
ncbi:MAG: ferrous iron transport protein B [Treponema sp.]|nr:ferrous iron transport protein B [Treponema sp.]